VVDPDWNAALEAVRNLRESKILFNPPLQMQQGRKERVEVRISSEDIGPALSEGLKGTGTPQVDSVRVSPVMKVVLTGDEGAFNIDNLSVEEQTVAGKPFAQWDYDVTPLKSGTQSLHLQVIAIIHIPERGEKPFEVPVIDKPIQVRINPWFASKRFIANNWQWLWTVIVIPGGGLLWRFRRKKSKRAGFR